MADEAIVENGGDIFLQAAGPVIIGLHPGTVDTGLSEPFQSNVPQGKLFTPEFSAARLLQVIDERTLLD